MDQHLELFEQHRPLLLGAAYRLLGSMWDAEDVVQDAYLRWSAEDRSQVREPRAFLITIVSRLALDRLRAARRRRETYPGPWLPEPVDSSLIGPLDTAELRETVAFATLHLMEQLSPPERAVFVLREAFGLPHESIAAIVNLSAAHCRQLLARARRRLDAGVSQAGTASGADHARLLEYFLQAAHTGNLTALAAVLADDVVAWNDGGGRVRAALQPITGRSQVLRFIGGLMSRYDFGPATIVDVNGHPALRTRVGGHQQLVALRSDAGCIHAIFAVLNPDKLQHVPTA